MQNVSETFTSLWEKNADLKIRVTIGNVTYTNLDDSYGDIIEPPVISANLFGTDEPCVGSTVAREVDFSVLPLQGSYPKKRDQIKIFISYTNGILTSEEVAKGTFYISSEPEKNEDDGSFRVHGVDILAYCNKKYTNYGIQGTANDTWPKYAIDVVTDIANKIGVKLDSRLSSIMGRSPSNDIRIMYPGFGPDAYKSRDVLSYCGAAYCGNWTITDKNELMLVRYGAPITNNTTVIALTESDIESVRWKEDFGSYGGIEIDIGDEENIPEHKVYVRTSDTTVNPKKIYYELDGETGQYNLVEPNLFEDPPINPAANNWYTLAGERVLQLNCPIIASSLGQDNVYDTAQIMAANFYTTSPGLAVYKYTPYEALNAILCPNAELGDSITINGINTVIAAYECRLDILSTYDLSAPVEDLHADDTDDDSVTAGYVNTQIQNAKDGIVNEVFEILPGRIELRVDSSSGEGGSSASIALYVNGETAGSGQILIDGAVDISGTLSADALYAALGDIADLTVKSLSTSKRILLYLQAEVAKATGDPDQYAAALMDDNYIQVEGQDYKWMTGKVKYTNWNPTTGDPGGPPTSTDHPIEIQAKNPTGALLYWEQPITTARGSDGYPVDSQGVRINTTTDPSSNEPVMVFDYVEDVKAKLTFELGESGYYEPAFILGSGDNNGKNIATINKPEDGLHIHYKVPNSASGNAGKTIGIEATKQGFLDFYGQRRITSMDFTSWDEGSFILYLEGNKQVDCSVSMDRNGVPQSITVGGFTTRIQI